MCYADILVQIDERSASKARAAIAAQIAKQFGAVLSAAFLKADLLGDYMRNAAMAGMPFEVIEETLKTHDRRQAAAERRAHDAFNEVVGGDRGAGDWLTISGDDDHDMIACARRHDLTVVPPRTGSSLGPHRIAASALALESGGPLLIVPERTTSAAIGRRILIAWKGTRESARALHDAEPFLREAGDVFVLTVSPKPLDGASGLLERHLAHLSVNAILIDERRGEGAAGRVIRDYVKSLEIDLLVMGLYGRPRVQELILGGVSDDLVHAPPCAILASH